MRRMVSATLAVGMVAVAAGAALAYPGRGPAMMGAGPCVEAQGPSASPGLMGPGAMGPGPRMMGAHGPRGPMGSWGARPEAGPMAGGQAAATEVTEEKAKELVTAYADKYFKGFTVERVLPFTARFRTMYQAELKGPAGEKRVLHVNPWGQVRPFGPPVVQN